MEDNKNIEIQKAVDETVSEMKRKIKELSEENLKIKDNDDKEKLEKLRTYVVDGFNSTIDSLEKMQKDLGNNEKVKESAEFITAKTGEIYDAFITRVTKINEDVEVNKKVSVLKENADNLLNKVTTNPKIKSVLDKKKPEIDEAVDKAKDLTIEVCEKGVDALKKWLKPSKKQVQDESEKEV